MTIEDLITEGEAIKNSIDQRHKMGMLDDYNVWRQKVLRFLNQEVPGDMVIHNFDIAVKCFNSNYCSPQAFDRVLSVLKAFKELPKITKDTTPSLYQKQGTDINITNQLSQNQEQHQSQKQDVIVKILLEAVKDELTGKQWKELLAVAKETKDSEMTRKNIMEKIKDFGDNVAANIVANIFTNPEVWQCLGSLL